MHYKGDSKSGLAFWGKRCIHGPGEKKSNCGSSVHYGHGNIGILPKALG